MKLNYLKPREIGDWIFTALLTIGGAILLIAPWWAMIETFYRHHK
mgnify:CR=1 FL=1